MMGEPLDWLTMPPAVTVSASASSMTMPPEVVFSAVRDPRAVSMSAAPVLPMPVAALSVARPVVVRLAVSAAVLSVIAPAVAVTLRSPEVLMIWESATLVAAV